MRKTLLCSSLLCFMACAAHSADDSDSRLMPRVEVGGKFGNNRSVASINLWLPLQQTHDSVLFTDLRFIRDDQENSEGNFGLGYRTLLPGSQKVGGIYAFLDRRRSGFDHYFTQTTVGTELLGEDWEFRLNGYVPVSNKEEISPAVVGTNPVLTATGIEVDVFGAQFEEPQHGLDAEVGYRLPLLEDRVDRARVFLGAYAFRGDESADMDGVRVRSSVEITSDWEMGARWQHDNIRGTQSFFELTYRFGGKTSRRTGGYRARLDDTVERDIDIVTRETLSQSRRAAVTNLATGNEQRIIYVDNQAAPGGDGSLGNPYATLADGMTASAAHDIIYVRRGDGSSTGLDGALLFNKQGQQLIGAGSNLQLEATRHRVDGIALNQNITLIAAGASPTIQNSGGTLAAITADDVTLAGFTITNPAAATALTITDADNIRLSNLNVSGGAVGLAVTQSTSQSNPIVLDNVSILNTTGSAINAIANGGSMHMQLMNNTLLDNNGGNTIFFQGNAGAVTSLTVNDTIISDSNRSGLFLQSNGGVMDFVLADAQVLRSNEHNIRVDARSGAIVNVELYRADFLNNSHEANGVFGTSPGGSQLDVAIHDSTFSGNGGRGIRVASGGGDDSDIRFMAQRTTITGQTGGNGHGIELQDNTSGDFVIDLGGGSLGSEGRNRIFGNSQFELRFNPNANPISARNNWWGSASGLASGDVSVGGFGLVDQAGFLTADPI